MGTFYLLSFLVLSIFIVPIIYEIKTNKFDVFNIGNGNEENSKPVEYIDSAV